MAETLRSQATGANTANSQVAISGQPARSNATSRWVVFFHAFFFVLGFTLVFTLLGSAAGLLGRSLTVYMPVIQKMGAILLTIFGLTTLGFFRWLVGFIEKRVDVRQNPAAEALVSLLNFPNQMLYTEKRVTDMHQVSRNWGYLSSSLMGVSFAGGWVPCIGPILASILFLASDSQTALKGAGLLLIYSMGLGIPFLLTGLMFSNMTRWLRAMNRHLGIVSIISGLFMLYVAYMLWTDSLAALTTQFAALNEWIFQAEEQVSSIFAGGGNLIGAAASTEVVLAFSAGLISFLSPCVLPLVPAYIGYLSGAAVGVRPKV
jgi:cytochrome c-type biogenesis protein